MKADGEVDWEVARAKLPSEVTQEQADQIYNACKDISKYTMNLTRATKSIFIELFTELIL